jgi:hypothetical protein
MAWPHGVMGDKVSILVIRRRGCNRARTMSAAGELGGGACKQCACALVSNLKLCERFVGRHDLNLPPSARHNRLPVRAGTRPFIRSLTSALGIPTAGGATNVVSATPWGKSTPARIRASEAPVFGI